MKETVPTQNLDRGHYQECAGQFKNQPFSSSSRCAVSILSNGETWEVRANEKFGMLNKLVPLHFVV
jgi:hypothetical protein